MVVLLQELHWIKVAYSILELIDSSPSFEEFWDNKSARLIRALEICAGTAAPKSQEQVKTPPMAPLHLQHFLNGHPKCPLEVIPLLGMEPK